MSHTSSSAPRLSLAKDLGRTPDARSHGRWLLLARVGWTATAVIALILEVAATPIAWQLLQTPCTTGPCTQQINQLTPAQAHSLLAFDMSLATYALLVTAIQWGGTLLFVGVALLIFSLKSDDRMALFAALVLVTFGGASANGWTEVLPQRNPLWAVPGHLIGIVGQVAFYLFFCLFPSGHFVPRWVRWPALVYAVLWLLTLFPMAPLNTLATTTNVVFVVLIGVLVIAQVYRYRAASTAAERQQTKWVVFGFAISIGLFLALLIYGNLVLGPQQHEGGLGILVPALLFPVLFWFIPISICIAILRSRLWDIDIIIRRTLVYGTLTVLLAGIYFGTVLGMQHLAIALAGTDTAENPLILVLSTLLIAALFQPLRTRLQHTIDRRFYRQKYDAAKTLESFAATLRGEVDLADLERHLVGVVEDTMQPAHVSLWLRREEGMR